MHRAGSIALLAIFVITAAAACAPTATSSPATPTGGQPTPAATTTGTTAAASLPTQTDTDWGRIWDALPPSFPAPPDSQPATDTGEGPSSAQVSVAGQREAIVQFYLDALAAAGYTVNRDGPLEDGSVTINGSRTGGCEIRLSVRPVDGGAIVTVLYGAACPFA
jgi:hypothetical protein